MSTYVPGIQPLVIQVALTPRVRLKVFAAASGLTVRAIQLKIARGKWLEGLHYHRDPEGHIWIDVQGVMSWIAPKRR